jgi:hypothetical protein
MATSIVDGTVAEATVKRVRGGFSVFSTLRFDLDDGTARTVKNAVATQAVAETLTPGNRGRFYLFTAMDIKGVHGARLADGRSVYGFPANNEKLFLVIGVISIVLIAAMLIIAGNLSLLPVLALILAVIGYIFMSKGKREAKAQFDGDVGDAQPPPPFVGA